MRPIEHKNERQGKQIVRNVTIEEWGFAAAAGISSSEWD